MKLQIYNEEQSRWQNINHSGYNNMSETAAQNKARKLNQFSPYKYRAVNEQCPQEKIEVKA